MGFLVNKLQDCKSTECNSIYSIVFFRNYNDVELYVQQKLYRLF